MKIVNLRKTRDILFKVVAAGFAPKNIHVKKKRRKFAKEAALEIARKNMVENMKPKVSSFDIISLLKNEVVLKESYDEQDNCHIVLGVAA